MWDGILPGGFLGKVCSLGCLETASSMEPLTAKKGEVVSSPRNCESTLLFEVIPGLGSPQVVQLLLQESPASCAVIYLIEGIGTHSFKNPGTALLEKMPQLPL